MIVGGLVMAASSFLNWNEVVLPGGSIHENGWDKGMLGLYQVLIGAVVAIFGIMQMAGKPLTGRIATLSINQWMIALSVAVAIWGFGLQFADTPEIGVLTTWVGGVIGAAGATMSERSNHEAHVPSY